MITIDKATSGFTYSSFKERMYNHINPLAETTEHKYTPVQGKDKYDYTCVSASTIGCIVEIKVRNLDHQQYPTAMIEESKYNYLMSVNRDFGLIPLFQCYYNDGKVLLFNLLEFPNLPTETYNCPQYSSVNSGKIQKPVKNLPVERALKLTYNKPDEEKIRSLFFQKYLIA